MSPASSLAARPCRHLRVALSMSPYGWRQESFALGWVLFGVATARAGVFPRTVAKIATIVFGIGIAWLSNAPRSSSS
jgi:hypothetical protein